MADVFNIPTLMICTGTATFVVAVSLTLTWFRDRQRALGLWCTGLWIGTAAGILLSLHAVAPPLLSNGLGDFLAAAAYSLMWLGARAFYGRSLNLRLAAAGPVLWLVLLAAIPSLGSDTNQRVLIMSLVIGAYSAAIAWEMFAGRKSEPLPSRDLAVIFFTSHAIIYMARVPLTLVTPAYSPHTDSYSIWYALITFELFVHTMISAVVLLMLIKERAEARYREASERDPLTGIYNRRFFVERVAQMIGDGRGGIMMVLDIDHFKRVNDSHGHLVGDRVLVDFAGRINAEIGGETVFCRFGGEEFALYAAALDLDRGLELAEGIRHRASTRDVTHMGQRTGVTVSIGVVAVEQVVANFDALLGAADLALYEAKRGGRNRVVAYDPVLHLNRIADTGRMLPADTTSLPQPRPAAG